MASLYNIHLRTGCFCNTGACQKFLNLSNKQVKDNLSAGHVCGDDVDLIDGKPTGSVRISFGYVSNFADARKFLNFIKECFLERDLNGTSLSLHSNATLPTNSVLTEHHQDTASSNCHKNNIHSNSEQNSTVHSTPNHKVSIGITILDDFPVNSLQHSKNLRLEKICLYPIKSCAAFEVMI